MKELEGAMRCSKGDTLFVRLRRPQRDGAEGEECRGREPSYVASPVPRTPSFATSGASVSRGLSGAERFAAPFPGPGHGRTSDA